MIPRLSLTFFLHQTTTGVNATCDAAHCLLPFSTSNHNSRTGFKICCRLSLTFFLHQTTTAATEEKTAVALSLTFFLHQTTTMPEGVLLGQVLSLTFFLHQTTTSTSLSPTAVQLSLTFFLHQTTTVQRQSFRTHYCLLPFFYIKPQLVLQSAGSWWIVSYLFSTSNHNRTHINDLLASIVSYLFSTSNHNRKAGINSASELSLTFFLHQTTTHLG